MDALDVLQEIPSDVLTNFRRKMTESFPCSIHGYAFISTLVKWKEKKPELPIEIVAPNGDPRLGIVFYFIFNKMFIGSVYAQDEKSVESLQESLIITKKVPFLEKEMCQFTCLNELALKTVNKLTALPEWKAVNHIRNGHRTLWMPSYKARQLDFKVPEGVEVRALTKIHAKQLNDHWAYNFEGSEKLLELMIELNFGVGVFRGQALLSWALVWYYGGIGSVETLDEERGKGYGRAVVGALVRKMGEMDMDVHLNVVVGNEKAEQFFKNLGFKFGCSAMWISRCMDRHNLNRS